jgi:hypothetical protein
MLLVSENTMEATDATETESMPVGQMTLGIAGGVGSERRRGLRIRQNRPIKIFEPTTHKYFGGQTQDVSATGLRIELPLATPIGPGKLVNVHVGLSDRGESLANRRHMIPARIVWMERTPNLANGRLTAGIEFISSIAAHLDAA